MTLFFVLSSVLIGQASTDRLHLLNKLESVQVKNGSEQMKFLLKFRKNLTEYPEPMFFDHSIQLEFSNAWTHPAKQSIDTGQTFISEVFLAQFNPETLRVRLIFGDSPLVFDDNFHMEIYGKTLEVRLDKQSWAQPNSPNRFQKASRSEPTQEVLPEDSIPDLDTFLAKMNEGVDSVETYEKAETEPLRIEMEDEDQSINRSTVDDIPEEQSKPVSIRAGLEDSRGSSDTNQSGFTGDPSTNKPKLLFQRDGEEAGSASSGLAGSGLKMFYGLFLVLGMMFIVFHILKKTIFKGSFMGSKSNLVTVLGTGYLGPKKMVMMTEVAGEILVLGVSGDSITMLTKITDPEKVRRIKQNGVEKPIKRVMKKVAEQQAKPKPEKFKQAQTKQATEKVDSKVNNANFQKYLKQQKQAGEEANEAEEDVQSVEDVTKLIRRNLDKIQRAS